MITIIEDDDRDAWAKARELAEDAVSKMGGDAPEITRLIIDGAPIGARAVLASLSSAKKRADLTAFALSGGEHLLGIARRKIHEAVQSRALTIFDGLGAKLQVAIDGDRYRRGGGYRSPPNKIK